MKVYVVTSGSYSDYHVDAIFSTRKKALAFTKAFPEDDCNGVVEWDVDVDLRVGLDPYLVVMLYDGTTERVSKQDRSRYNFKDAPFFWKRTKAPAYRGKGIPDALSGTFWADSPEGAVKAANEVRVRWIAKGKWKPGGAA